MSYFRLGIVLIELLLSGAIVVVVARSLRQSETTVLNRSQIILGNALIYIAVLILVASGISKFLGVAPAMTEMTVLGMTGYKYYLVASLEVLDGILLFYQRFRSIALLLVSAQAGGAICAHLIANQEFAALPSAVVLSICWLGVFLRHPQSLWSTRKLT